MEKKSVCKSCTAGKPYPNKQGAAGEMLYPWNVSFENGDDGQRSTKSDQPPYIVGQEYPYELVIGTWPDGKEKRTIKAVNNNPKFKKQDPTLKLKGYAISYANRFVLSEIIPRPKDEKALMEENSEDWNKFRETVQKYIKDFYKQMKASLDLYGADNADVIGVALSNAIDARINKKIRRDYIWVYYNTLLEAILVKPEPAPQA